MPFVVGPSKNPTTRLAFALLDGKPAKAPVPPPSAKQKAARAALAKAEKAAAKHAPKKRPAAKKGKAK